MDKNTIIGLILIFAVFIGFSMYNTKKLDKGFNAAVEQAEAELAAGNLESARTYYVNALRYKPNQPDVLDKLGVINSKLGIVTEEVKEKDTSVISRNEKNDAGKVVVPDVVDGSRYGVFSDAAKGEDKYITLENNVLEMKIALKGGRVYSARLKNFTMFNSSPLILFSGDSTVFGFNFFTADNKAIQTNNLYFKPVSDKMFFNAKSNEQTVALRLYAAEDKYIEYQYSLEPDKYSVKLKVLFKNLSDVMPQNQNSLSVDWRMYMPQQEKGRINEENYTSLKYKYYQDDVEGATRSTKESENYEVSAKLDWVAYQDQFFSSVLIADKYFLNGIIKSQKTPESKKYIKYYSSDLGIPFDPSANNSELDMKFYFGPNHIKTLKKEAEDLEKIVFLGKNIIGWISRFIIIPTFNWLAKYIASYGIIILILTILIKIILFPLTFKSYQSTAKMQILRPMVEELNKKYPKKEDELKRQQATMDLYKRAGVNVMGGCLPTLLQFPILFAMFRFFPVSIELRQQSFLWATDLSTYDSILDLPFNIPLYGDHVSLFTLLMTVASILTMKITNNAQAQTGPNQMTMKMMTYVMPIMFLFMFNNFSSGLTYYYFLANMISLLQNLIMKKIINEEKVLATLKENSKKPLKKSKWQKRLEEAQRQQQAMYNTKRR